MFRDYDSAHKNEYLISINRIFDVKLIECHILLQYLSYISLLIYEY